MRLGGTPRGPDSICSTITAAGGCGVTGATAHGSCCVDGNCLGTGGYSPEGIFYPIGYTAGDCSALGGLWGGSGGTCGVGNTFDTSWPCSWPTGACCFGDSPVGGITYCDSGMTYGDCMNPPSLGGSGGGGWKEGVTCGTLTEIISPDGATVGCIVSENESGVCCIPEYFTSTLEGPYENQVILVNYNCYQTSSGTCNNIGGKFTGGVNCDEIDCCDLYGDCSRITTGCCGQHTQDIGDATRECIENVDIVTCQAKKDIWWQNVNNTSEVTYSRFGFASDCSELENLGICSVGSEKEEYLGLCCGFLPPWVNSPVCELEHIPNPRDWGSMDFEGTCPIHPENYRDGYVWTSLHSMPISDNIDCNNCSQMLSADFGACCDGTNCFDTIREHCSGDFFEGMSCSLNCGFLPCCDNITNEVNVCVDESVIRMDEGEFDSYSHCHDKYSFPTSEFNSDTALSILTPKYQNIEAFSVYENPETHCEDCSSPCSRNRGTCCWNGQSIFNITSEECRLFGGNFLGCEGIPFNKTSVGGFNYNRPSVNCDSSSYSNDTPINVRAVGIPEHGKERLRRGPFHSDNVDLCAASNENWKDLDWQNGDRIGPKETYVNIDPLVDQLPIKPLVHIFWNSAENAIIHTNNILNDLDNPAICNTVNLHNCKWPLDKLGTCCVIDNSCGDDARLDSLQHNCFKCVSGISQCECARRNNQRSCDNINWIPDVIDCSECPCQDINNSDYQIDSKCITGSTHVIDNTLNEGNI